MFVEPLLEHAQASGAREEYARRLARRGAESARHERTHRILGNFRLAAAGLALLIVWLPVSLWWLLLPAAIFVILAVAHDRVLRRLALSRRSEAFYRRGISRLEDRWAGSGETGDRYSDPKHPYAEDLDLFGSGGLFQLLSGARTQAGEDTLARWLLQPSPVQDLRPRQEAILELKDRLDLRENLALLGDEDTRTGVQAAALASWGRGIPVINLPWARWVAPLLVAVLAISVAGWALFGWPLTPVLIVILLEGAFAFYLRAGVAQVVAEVEQPGRDLALLSQVLVLLERERFSSPRLAALRADLDTEGRPASGQIARLARLIEMLDSRDHLFLRAAGPLLLWTTQLALAVAAWRARCGPSVPRWLEAVGEIEALCSLAAYTNEHPEDPFPEFVLGGPHFKGEGLAHPLLPAARAVRNDVHLDSGRSLLLVSGSNMSGKSTLLRTVGVNAVLALAGAPVRARRLKISPLAVGASMRIHDSLQAGTSRFYAEVLKVRQLVGMAEQEPPLLFLLDELFHGTNSHDRRIGAGAVLRSLVERNAIGLATTHDLSLASIVEELAPRAANVHFEDHFEDGRLSFDYRMRPGVVRKSNALELMRSVGLDV